MRSCPSDQAWGCSPKTSWDRLSSRRSRSTSRCAQHAAGAGITGLEIAAPVTPVPRLLPEAGEPPMIPGFSIEGGARRGATAVVYLALDQKLGRRVLRRKVLRALTMPIPVHASDGVKKSRAFARVRHPSVVALYEAVDNGAWRRSSSSSMCRAERSNRRRRARSRDGVSRPDGEGRDGGRPHPPGRTGPSGSQTIERTARNQR